MSKVNFTLYVVYNEDGDTGTSTNDFADAQENYDNEVGDGAPTARAELVLSLPSPTAITVKLTGSVDAPSRPDTYTGELTVNYRDSDI